MTQIITEAQIQERIDLYVKENQAAITADIDSRVEKAINNAIKEVFNGRGYGSPKWNVVEEAINGKVQAAIELAVSEVELDKDEILRLATKKIKTQINKMEIGIVQPGKKSYL